jgi:hypothetical protein
MVLVVIMNELEVETNLPRRFIFRIKEDID